MARRAGHGRCLCAVSVTHKRWSWDRQSAVADVDFRAGDKSSQRSTFLATSDTTGDLSWCPKLELIASRGRR
jgi:hypothetical protein